MAFTCISKNKFQEDLYFSHFTETKKYIIAVQVSTHGPSLVHEDETYIKKIGIYDKKMQFIREISFKYPWIEKVLVKAEANVLAIICPKHHRIVIIDLEIDQQREIELHKRPDFEGDEDDEDEQGVYPSEFYWWKGDILFVHTIYHRIYCINTVQLESTIISMQELESECLDLYVLLHISNNYSGVEWVNPHEYQFTYSNGETIGFVDIKKETHHSALYIAGDVHTVYFYNNIFIVPNCYSIELVNGDGIKTAYKLPKENHNEMERSLFISKTGELVVVDAYWSGSTRYDSLLHFLLDGQMGSFSQKEKEQYAVMKYLKDHPSDTNAWLRLILIEEYDDDRLAGKWFDKLRLYNPNTIYTLLILAYSDVSGHLYNSLRLSTHEDPKIMAAIKYAMSRYLKKRGDLRRYEQVLLKSIEYFPNHVKSLAALGEFYLDNGRIDEGIKFITKAINNVKVVYTNENRNRYDKYDIQEFVNEHYKGIHITQENYNQLKSLI